MIDKEKASLNMRKQWMKFGCAFFFYVLFIIWMSPRTLTGWILTLLGAMFIFDCYVSKKVRWQWWKDAEGPVKFIMSWVDALVFALVAVYFITSSFSRTTSYRLLRWRRASSRATTSSCRR